MKLLRRDNLFESKSSVYRNRIVFCGLVKRNLKPWEGREVENNAYLTESTLKIGQKNIKDNVSGLDQLASFIRTTGFYSS
jgi:hypothetical protein